MQEKIYKALKAPEKAKIFILLLCQPSDLIPNINAHMMFQKSSTTRKAELQNVIYYSPDRVEKFVDILITCLIFVLFFLPVVAMFQLTSIGDKNEMIQFGILLASSLLFSAAMSLLRRAKEHELFAPSALYWTVLVMFTSNLDNSRISPAIDEWIRRGLRLCIRDEAVVLTSINQ